MDINLFGKLYVVATPIGNLADLSARGQNTLSSVSWIASEDTRHSQSLLTHYGISPRCFALHAFNEKTQSEHLIQLLKSGQSGALISDAGTPLVSDPGFHLIQACHEHQVEVVAIPGPCAAIAALSVLAIQEGPFHFEGFLPPKSSARKKRFEALKDLRSSLVFYEAPHRIEAMLEDAKEVLGENRLAGIGRELTKKFESLYRGSLSELHVSAQNGEIPQKGEFVVVIAGESETAVALDRDLEKIITTLLAHLPAAQAAKAASQLTGIERKVCYDMALSVQKK